MNARTCCLLALLVVAGVARAQYPVPPRLPSRGASPLLYVRFSGPDGLKATFYQGRARPRLFPTPVVVGLRPGYRFRVQLSNLPERPGVTLYPTVEVRGNLHLPPLHGAHNFPATVDLTPADLESAAAGSVVTKVIYLENPDRAEPRATRPGQILETDVGRARDIYDEARNRGRIMVVVHLGERVPTVEELVSTNVPGTILFPGEKVVALPAGPPVIPLASKPFFDPLHGPRPLDEECLHDGGDRMRPAGFDLQGNLAGVDPEDTVAEYRDSAGRRQIACSNRVCLTVPRFAALRKEVPLASTEGSVGPQDRRMVQRRDQIEERKPPRLATVYEQPRGYDARLRPGVNVNVEGPGVLVMIKALQAQQLNIGVAEYIGTKRILTLSPVQKALLVKQLELVRSFSVVTSLQGFEQIERTAVVARIEGTPEVITSSLATRDLTVCCNETPIPPDKPLVLFKCADRGSAQVGDVVTFTLRYSNVGGRAMTDVAVADSLAARLEYVPDSAETDRDAVFTIQENEAGSSLLRWEITGKLLPGQSGRLRFKARVR